jgi:hypothetical protein
MSFRLGTAINCIDERTQEVVIDYMKQKYSIDWVDMVAFPGADEVFSAFRTSIDCSKVHMFVL